ncbi:hypothetical protein DL98DRAFT_586499 [Cadophora sp. DSE1049]|nr:hypothetical protein DL98DRAFT_586499 [Cadophora sp. DSE1049]
MGKEIQQFACLKWAKVNIANCPLVTSEEVISVAFGLAGVAIALATYFIARKRSVVPEPDAELALLNTGFPLESPHPSLEELDSSATTASPAAAVSQQNNQLHEVIGDALELFSRHLRGRN